MEIKDKGSIFFFCSVDTPRAYVFSTLLIEKGNFLAADSQYMHSFGIWISLNQVLEYHVQHKSELQSSGWHYDFFKTSQYLK